MTMYSNITFLSRTVFEKCLVSQWLLLMCVLATANGHVEVSAPCRATEGTNFTITCSYDAGLDTVTWRKDDVIIYVKNTTFDGTVGAVTHISGNMESASAATHAIEIREIVGVDNNGNYTCTVNGTLDWYDLQVESAECPADPCSNDAVCTEGCSGYQCECLPNYRGLTCADNCTNVKNITGNTMLKGGDDLELTCYPATSSALVYWSRDSNGDNELSSEGTLSITQVKKKDAGIYYCFARYGGCTSRMSASVTVARGGPLKIWEIAVIAVAALLVVAIIIGIIVYFVCIKKKDKHGDGRVTPIGKKKGVKDDSERGQQPKNYLYNTSKENHKGKQTDLYANGGYKKDDEKSLSSRSAETGEARYKSERYSDDEDLRHEGRQPQRALPALRPLPQGGTRAGALPPLETTEKPKKKKKNKKKQSSRDYESEGEEEGGPKSERDRRRSHDYERRHNYDREPVSPRHHYGSDQSDGNQRDAYKYR